MAEDQSRPWKWVAPGFLAVVALAPTQWSIEIAKGVHLSPVDPLAWLVGLVWGFGAARRLRFGALRRVCPFAAAFVFLLAASGLRAAMPAAAAKETVQAAEYFVVVYALAGHFARDRRLLERTAAVFLAAGTVVVLAAAIQYGTASVPDFGVRGTFGNRNVFGGYLAMLLPFAYGCLLAAPRPWLRAWPAAVLAVGFAVNLAGGTFAALMAAFGVMGAMAGRRALAVTALIFLAAAAVGLPRLPRRNAEVMYQSVRPYADEVRVSRRYTEWQAAAAMAAAHPWMGVGAGGYQRHIGGYYGVLPIPARAAEPDSQCLYLVLASAAGFPALACFASLLLRAAAVAGEAFYRGRDRLVKGLALGALGGIIGFAVNSVWSPLLVRGIGVPLAVLLGLAAALGDRSRAVAGDATGG